MTSTQSTFMQLDQADTDHPQQLSDGLASAPAFISPKYFYDALGSKLFAAICEVQEYYPTRTEAGIFEKYLPEIAETVGGACTLIDLGAGDCAKASKLFDALQPAQYVAIDISVTFLKDALRQLQSTFPHIPMLGLGMDFSASMYLPDQVSKNNRLFFYPGSSIGNFTPAEALAFFKRIRAASGANSGLLIGVDLVKDHRVLNAAYNDSLGVTAAFNLNVLLHLNKLLGANFDIALWRHVSFFNAEESRIEMYLEAKVTHTVKWQGGERLFQAGARIHTENSYKYTQDSFVDLLRQAGMNVTRTWCDANNWFLVCYASMS